MPRLLALACLLVAGGCAVGEPSREPASDEPVFTFLAERYDRDGDGVVRPEEYDRDARLFTRLDRTGDGVLTAADFRPTGRRVRGLGVAEARRLRAVHLLAWYVQDDDEPARVRSDEVARAFEAYDADADGRVGRREFEARAHDRRSRGRRPAGEWAGLLEVETTDPWERLLAGVDTDDDGFLTARELTVFHAANAGDLAFDAHDVFAPERSGATPSLEGRPAPDFTLPWRDGGGTLTLSDLRDERPVALIFGSYT